MKSDTIGYRILSTFTLIYPIIPSYFRIFGIVGQIFILTLTSILLLLLNFGKYPVYVKDKHVGVVVSITYIWAAVFIIISTIYNNSYGVLTTLLPWFVILNYYIKYINTKERFIRIIDIIILTGVIVSVLSIIEAVTSINVFDYLNTDQYSTEVGLRLGFRRVFSFSSHPISYSLYCLFITVLIIYRLFLPDEKKKILLVVCYIIVFFSALVTFSRSSIIFIIFDLIICLWICGYKRFLKSMLVIILCLSFGLLFVYLLFPNLWNVIYNGFILISAVFSDISATQLASMGYQWDTSGVADRIDLWKIVLDKMNGYYLLGHGPSTFLTNTYVVNSLGNKIEKESIEVTPLLILYRYGIFAVFFEELRNIVQIVACFKMRKRGSEWEGYLNFNKICLVVLITYFFALMTVNQTDTVRIYFIISSLFIAYNKHNCYNISNRCVIIEH